MSAKSDSQQPIAAKRLMEDQISYEFAIYYLSAPASDPVAQLDELLKGPQAKFQRVAKIEGEEKKPTVAARMENDAASNYAPPDLESLQYFGRGLSREQAEALQQSQNVLILDFSYPDEHVWTGMRAALELTHDLANRTNGLIWDEMTREVFTTDAWQQGRIADWTENVPDITKHTVVHAYKKDEYVRAITLGMAKFGLPDVVIDNFSWSLNRSMGHVVNLFAQAIAEGAIPQRVGEFDLDLKAIKNAKVRDPQVTTLKSNATGRALLSIRQGIWEEGDPENRLIEITFDRGTGPDIHAKQEQILSAAFGWEDPVTQVKHDAALESASRKARSKLPALRSEYNTGLAPGEFIQVKAPFATPDGGQEWMWVEVTSWQGDKITGLLKNEPVNIPSLRGGQIVEVSEAKVFDYIRRHADGTTEGNETAKIIEKRSR